MIHFRTASIGLAVCLVGPAVLAQKPAASKPGPPPVGVTLPPGGGGFLGGADDCLVPHPALGPGDVANEPWTSGTTGTTGQIEANCLFFGTSGITNDVWYDWTANFTGNGTFTFCGGTGVDTKVAVWPGTATCPLDGTSIACNDDSCGLQSTVAWPITSGTTYTLQVGTFPGASGGSGTFSITQSTPLPNDDCSTPDSIAGQGTFAFDLTGATTGTTGQNETNCFKFGTSGITNDVWFCWMADADGTTTLTTCGLASFDTKVAVYPGCGCPADGTSLDCNDDACGLQSTIAWSTCAGETYTLQIGTFPGATGGSGTFDISTSPSGPSCTPGTPVCFGDGSGAACACANEAPVGSGDGCLNSLGVGANLAASGSNSIGANNLTLTASDIRSQPGLFFQAVNTINGGAGVTFGDGIRCCGGNVLRLSVESPSGPQPNTTETTLDTTALGVTPGDKRCYQYWYRDPGANNPCGGASNFNLSNAVTITWVA